MSIAGLDYIKAFVTADEEAALLSAIHEKPWRRDFKRRVQHYGFRYAYKARSVEQSLRLEPLPVWALPVATRLVARGYFATAPDQLIVNEYEPGQGISPHVDCERCFGPVICCISLGSHCVMEFMEVAGTHRVPVLLERRSAVVLSSPARTDWKHAIPPRKSDRLDGRMTPRGRRVSLTFRSVLFS